MSYVCLVLPFPPTVNNMFVNSPKTRGRFPSRQYKEWRNEAEAALAKQDSQPRIGGAVSLIFTFGRPDRRRRDISNYIKAPEDFIVKSGLIDDDSLVEEIIARWSSTVVGVQIEVTPFEVEGVLV